MRIFGLAATGLLALAFTGGAGTSGHTAILFTANLTTSQETVPVNLTTALGAPRPTPFGTANFSLSDAQDALSMSVTVTNIDITGTQTPDLNDNLVAAHIHAPAPPGTNAGVVWGFLGLPFNDNNPTDLVVTPFASGVGGMFSSVWNQPEGNNTLLTLQVPNLLGGLAYLNFHTVQNPGGEIRGQILPQPVPEPSSLLLLGTALAGLLGFGARRARKAC